LGGLPVVGPALAAAAVLGGIGYINSQKVGDLGIDPNGGPIVSSPREGGLFQGTKNDGLMMAPGIGTKGVGSGAGVNTAAIVAAIRETKDVYMDGRRVTSRVASSVEKSSKNQYGFG
jgi:hypothetical protein